MYRNFPGAIALLQDGPVGIVVSRMSDGVILETNVAFLRMIGYEANEVQGHTIAELNIPVDFTARDDVVADIKSNGHAFDFPFKVRSKSGNISTVRCSAIVIDVAGEVCILTVIHLSKSAASTLDTHRNDAAQLDEIEESAGVGFWDFDAPSAQVRWSYGMESIYGLPRGGFNGTQEDLLGRIHPDDFKATVEKRQDSFREKRAFDIQFRIVRPDGSVRWVVSRGSPRFDATGTFVGASGLQIDVTNQVVTDDALRLHARVMENMAEGVVTVDADTRNILSANRRFEEMLGYAQGALIGLPIHTVNAANGREPVEVADEIIGQLKAHGVWRGEVKNLCANGTEIWCSCTVSETKLSDNKAAWIYVHTDITERRLVEEDRDRALAQLQRMSFNYQDSLEAERAALALDVHEKLFTSLTGIETKLAELTGTLRLRAPDLAEVAQQLRVAIQATQTAAQNIATQLRPSLLDDMGLTEACRWYINDWSETTGIPVTSRLNALKTEPCPNVAIDMFRSLQELLKNVALHSRATKAHVALSDGKFEIKLRVQDNGQGFDEELNAGGFGLLGVRERARHRGGDIELETSPVGTQVTITMRR